MKPASGMGLRLFAVAFLFLEAFSVSNADQAAAQVPIDASIQQRYIVRFAENPLAHFDGKDASGNNLPLAFNSIPRTRSKLGRQKLDSKSAEAKAYVGYLRNRQSVHLNSMTKSLGRDAVPLRQMQHALNAVVVNLTAEEASRVASLPGVHAVEMDRLVLPDTDISSGFIGATAIWAGLPAGQDPASASGQCEQAGNCGDGVVIGMIDTGYNSASPSFAATDSTGYAIKNPLGPGTYIGQCGLPGISIAGCNDKVIGVYDFSGATPYSVEDVYDHGAHTGSTAGGNRRTATVSGVAFQLSGVAPHANLVIYRVCSILSCSFGAMAVAVDQAIADGIVDVVNFSMSGLPGLPGPWSDFILQSLLAATDAGIFVAASAGNNGAAGSGSVYNDAPWITTVAASAHSGGVNYLNAQSVIRISEVPDRMAAFSSMGPASAIDVLKPDITAPGQAILAATLNDGSASGAEAVRFESGTSMSSPQVAGAAALIVGLHPDWAPLEIKSALMMTAKTNGVTKADGTTSDPFDRGSGRIQPFIASQAGLVLNETKLNFINANPATGGDPSTLNLPSMQKSRCITAANPPPNMAKCSFMRTVRSTRNGSVVWNLSVTGVPGTVTPPTFTLAA